MNKINHFFHWMGMIFSILGAVMMPITKKDYIEIMWPLTSFFWVLSSYFNMRTIEKLNKKVTNSKNI